PSARIFAALSAMRDSASRSGSSAAVLLSGALFVARGRTMHPHRIASATIARLRAVIAGLARAIAVALGSLVGLLVLRLALVHARQPADAILQPAHCSGEIADITARVLL